ncbi:hypothetical protein J3A83DRAFT_4094425 [Scleroderma citrinum]
MSPRPILKPHLDLPTTQEPFIEPFPFAACPSLFTARHVHFPPTPTLTSTFTTHSPSAYDRTPVVVAPNTCALPGRHEREHSSTPHASRSRAREASPKGSYFHPRAYEACAPEAYPPAAWSSSMPSPGHFPPPPFPLPQLIPDNSHDFSSDSESSSSDSQVSTPTDDDADPALHHHAMSMRYTMPTTTTASPSIRHHTAPVIPHSYLSSGESTLSYLPDRYPQSPTTKERKTGRRSSNNTSNRNPKGRNEPLDPHRSNFTFPSLDFEGCLGGF